MLDGTGIVSIAVDAEMMGYQQHFWEGGSSLSE
jgi:hypothetical protein